MAYAYENGEYVVDSNYKSAGFLSKTEYEISDSKNNTYLSNGLEYWTLSKSSASRHYVVNYRIQEKSNSDLSGIRVTEYINGNVSVSGSGSYADPWQFSDIISLHVNTTNKLRGRVSSVDCSNNSMKKETITLTFTDGGNTEVYLCPENGYKVYTNSCSGYMTKDTGNRYVINGVKKDNLICNVAFTYITNKVNLLCSGCSVNPAPSTLYASTSTHDLWFTEKNGTSTPISKINTVPQKTGYTFKGFYKNSNQIIDVSGNMLEGATAYISGTTDLNAKFEANTYTFTLNAPNATSNNHTTAGYVVYDEDIPNVIVPQRIYTVNYDANGGSVNRSSDTVTYTFDGYFYNGIKYIDSNGLSAHKWDIPSNVTLNGTWAIGNVTLAIPTRTGHVFKGWTVNSDGSGTVYNGQHEIFKFMSGSNTSVTLYAKWERCGNGTYLSSNSCVQCSAGYYSTGGVNSCTACAAGKYSAAGASSCSNCAAGTYSTGAASSCTTCTSGYYCPGNSNRIACPDGYTSGAGASAQANCYISVPPGKYLTTEGSTSIGTCTAGTYKGGHTVNFGSKSSCNACLKNSYSAAGASVCTTCSVGTYTTDTGSTSCISCPAGSYCPAGANPQSCPAGQYSPMNSASCSECGAGTYNSGTGNTGCSTCPAGYRCTGGANISQCPAGYYSNAGAVNCTRCSAGKYSAAGSASCSSCPAGTYSAAGASSCTSCPAGSYCSGGTNKVACPAGTYSAAGATSCSSCPAGQYSAAGSSSCTSCPAGSYCSGGTNKVTCPAGTYSAAGASRCTNCPAGKYSAAGASSCTTCTAGYRCPGGSNRIQCAAGTYSAAGASSCTSCVAGKYSAAGASSCTNCPAGKYSTGGASSCSTCPAGSYCPGGANKSTCAAGTYSAAGASSCSNCPAGKYSAAGASSCSTCTAGYRCPGGTNRIQCAAGTYAAAGASSCTSCSAGYYSAAGASSCSGCAAGKYSAAGASSCTSCTAGYRCPGSSNRIKCAAGTYAAAGSSSCTSCSAGYYSAAGAGSCSACPAGKYSGAGASSCTTCQAGYYCPGSSNRSTCTAGTYSAAGASSCTLCPAGQYSSAGASGCTSCAAGTYSTGGASSCTACPSGTTSAAGASSCYTIYEDKWVAGASGITEFNKNGGSGWSSVQTRLHWQEYYNAYTNQSYLYFSDFQAKSTAGAGVVYAGGGSGQTRGIFVLDSAGNKELIQKMSYHAGDTAFNFLNSRKNTWFSQNIGSTVPPWESKVYNHNSDGTLTLTLRVDLMMLPISSSFSAQWNNVDKTITLTDLR